MPIRDRWDLTRPACRHFTGVTPGRPRPVRNRCAGRWGLSFLTRVLVLIAATVGALTALAPLSPLVSGGRLDAQSQDVTVLEGRVSNEAGESVSGARVVVIHQGTGTQKGALTGPDGRYEVRGLRPGGPYRVETRMIGYGLQFEDDLTMAAGAHTIDFGLTREVVAMDAIEVLSTRAIERRTPVAFSDVRKVQIQQQLGSRDVPMALNVTPSVYATMQGGGAGDARMNIRGFDQRNTAVMVNGVPVNDMENGWVYWSNWDGLGDAATSVQVQRGLSAVNLATPSVGGTLNVITDPASRSPGVSYKQEFGSAGFLKETLSLSTGERGSFAFTGNIVRKQGDGFFETNGGLATYTDAWAYYGAASYQIDARNRLELYAVGAPQRHGQNLYKLNVAQIDHDFAREIGVSEAAIAAIPEAGRFWSPNVNRVDPSYAGRQYASSGPGAGTFRRHGASFLNERENFFHKPQVNLNYYAHLGDGLSWSTVAYYSGGEGGGSGTLGSIVWDTTYKQRVADWDATIAQNRANPDGRSEGILRASVNNQWTVGTVSKVRKEFDGGITAEMGVDWRTASIDHYRDVRDLLGGGHWLDDANEFTGERQTTFGDRIDYYNTNDVDWLGGHLQVERANEVGSIYGMVGLVRSSYDYTDHFRRAAPGSDRKLRLESGNLTGYQIKGGASRNLTREWSLYANAGYVSKVPIFDNAIDDVNAEVLPDPTNQTFISFEAGAGYRASDRGLSADLNFYHTTWRDRSFTFYVPNDEIFAQILGVDQRHLGVELQAAYQPLDLLRFDASASLGDWTYLADAGGRAVSGDRRTSTEYDYYIEGLKVSDQPQTQLAYAASVHPLEGLWMRLQGRTNRDYYAAFDPFSRTTPDDRGQSWKVPGHTVFDLHGGYRLNGLIPAWRGGDVRLFAHVFNLFDTLYVQDATDNSSFNAFYQCEPNNQPCAQDPGHDAEAAEVYLGLPRRYNVGIEIIF